MNRRYLHRGFSFDELIAVIDDLYTQIARVERLLAVPPGEVAPDHGRADEGQQHPTYENLYNHPATPT